ncbi:phage minor head protein [Methanobrevibacter sp.]|uniref:phage head morphogenesis protein n=1 Tax=Methanobrevibacter sp. TaxID=66852 RepID=UPI00386912DF
MKILFKTSKKKPTKNITSQRAYPHGVEAKYFRQLKGYFKPLTDYVTKYINENMEPLLRGDSQEIKLDAIPGNAFRDMLNNLENWLSVYMPDISEIPEPQNNNVIFVGLGKTAEEAYSFAEKDFEKTIEKGIHINPPVTSEWWNDMRNSWAEDNYTLITSNAKNYVSKINTLTEQAIVNGLSPKKLAEEIKKATESLSDKHCKLLARDQIGKLNGQITQAQMEEIGLELYVWSTSSDDRVRESHAVMEGLLCRWDDASVCSYDNGKTWEPRPASAVDLHPGQDIQCRCIGLAFYPELTAEVEGIDMEEITSDLPPVQEEFGNENIGDTVLNYDDYKKEFGDDFVDNFLIPSQNEYWDVKQVSDEISETTMKMLLKNDVQFQDICRKFNIKLMSREEINKLSSEEIKKYYLNVTKQITDAGDKLIESSYFAKTNDLSDLLNDEFLKDPIFKTLYETGTSKGSAEVGWRSGWENRISPYADKTIFSAVDYKKNAKLRPVYGSVFSKDEFERYLTSKTLPGSADDYGDSLFIFKKNSIKKRTSFTMLNSSNEKKSFTKLQTLYNYKSYNNNPSTASMLINHMFKDKTSFNSRRSYIECQVWGGVDFKRDIEKIVCPKSYKSHSKWKDFEKVMKECGIKIEYLN